jgi:hypothetical protein
MDPKASRSGILALDVQDFFEKGQGELIPRMLRRTRPLLLQASEPIPFKGVEDRIDMGA